MKTFLLLFITIFSFSILAQTTEPPKSFQLLNLEESDYEKKINELINQGVDLNSVDEYQANVLTVAANKDLSKLVSILLDYNVNPNIVGCNYAPALGLAVSDQDISLVKKLIAKGANIDDRSCMNNDFSIVRAIYNKDYAMVKYLIEQGADLNQRDFDGFSVFMYLCRYENSADLINYAIKNNQVNFNYQEEYSGETALMWAVENGRVENVQALLKYKINLHARNDQGRNVFEIAKKKKFKKIYRLLKLAQRQRS